MSAKKHCPLFLIFFLGVYLRFHNIAASGLWSDEISTIYYGSFQPISVLWKTLPQITTHPPLYYYLIGKWALLFGDSELSMRAPSAIIDSLNILLLAKLCARLGLAQPVQLGIALLYAVALRAIYYAQEGRPYVFLIFLALSYVLILIHEFSDRKSSGFSIRSVPIALVLAQSHFFGFLAVGYLGFVSTLFSSPPKQLWRNRLKMLKGPLLILLLCLCSYLPYMSHIFQHIKVGQVWIQPASLERMLSFGRWLLGPPSSNLIPMILLGCIFLSAFLRPRWNRLHVLAAIIWFFAGICFCFAYEWLRSPIWVERYLLFSLPAVFVLWSMSLNVIYRQNRALFAAVYGICFASMAYVFFTTDFLKPPRRGNIREAIQRIDELAASRSTIPLPVYGCTEAPFYLQYYLKNKTNVNHIDDNFCSKAKLSTISDKQFLFVRFMIWSKHEEHFTQRGYQIESIFSAWDANAFLVRLP